MDPSDAVNQMQDLTLKNWIAEIHRNTALFLSKMSSGPPSCPVKYSFSGDLLPQSFFWGLGNSVFALKSFFTLGLNVPQTSAIVAHILRFRTKEGTFTDPWVARLSLPFRLNACLRAADLDAFSHRETVRAETRQALCALNLFGPTPNIPVGSVPSSSEALLESLESLDWRMPWHAGSHFSHLIFFLSNLQPVYAAPLLTSAFEWLANMRQADGGWYRGAPILSQRINGAMKIITAFRAAERAMPGALMLISEPQARALIDTALSASNDRHACDHFNVTYVLRWCAQRTGHEYRLAQINTFMRERLDLYRQHYFPDLGGFSFEQGRANRVYYHARISRGLCEPDIHGTTLFLWGLSTILAFFGGEFVGLLKEHDA